MEWWYGFSTGAFIIAVLWNITFWAYCLIVAKRWDSAKQYIESMDRYIVLMKEQFKWKDSTWKKIADKHAGQCIDLKKELKNLKKTKSFCDLAQENHNKIDADLDDTLDTLKDL